MTGVLNKHVHTPTIDTFAARIGRKLNDTNYVLWSPVVEIYISAKYKLGHIICDLPPSYLNFRRQRTNNAIVKWWLINSIDMSLINNFIRFPTTKMVCDSITITCFDESDTSQLYNLRRHVMCLRQVDDSLEK